ncbi:MAG: phage tail tip fiber protein, partial [Solimonas sp.]
LSAAGALANVLLTWNAPQYRNHSYTEVWRATENTLGLAVMVGMAPGNVYSDSVGSGGAFYYWVRAVSLAGRPGPFNAVGGVLGQTGQDPAYLMELLTGGTDTPFFIQPEEIIINGYTVPAGTYIRDAYIMAGTITRAMIGLAAIDDARISNLSAAKITAGLIAADRLDANVITGKVLTVDAAKITSGTLDVARIGDGTLTTAKIAQQIQSTNYAGGSAGWAINKNGSAEFNNITVRGTVASSNIVGSSISGGSLNINGLFTVDANGNVTIRSAWGGARLEIYNSRIDVFDGNGTLRVRLGVW